MTAPTPEFDATTAVLLLREHALRAKTIDDAKWFHDVADLLAAVTVDRDYERTQHEITKQTLDQAWEDLHASKQMHEQARSLLDQALTDRDQARRMLAGAPHEQECPMRLPATMRIPEDKCSCWKAGL